MKEKRTLQWNITQAPSMKKWGQEMDFLVLQSNNITKYNDVKWDIFRYNAIHQDNIYM